MSYQRTTWTLNPGGHPGSCNGQDAYSDLLVVSDGNMVHRKWATGPVEPFGENGSVELHARSASNFEGGV